MEKIIIIPGLFYNKYQFKKMIKYFSDYDIYLFEPDYKKSTYSNIENLRMYINKNNIIKTHFIVHSYGSILIRIFNDEANCTVDKVVELAPINSGNSILKKANEKIKILPKIIGKAYLDLINNSKIFDIPLPKNTGIIAGTKRFSIKNPDLFIIPLFLNNKNSDGKILVEETKHPDMKDFITVHETHDNLPTNMKVLKLAKNFIKKGNF